VIPSWPSQYIRKAACGNCIAVAQAFKVSSQGQADKVPVLSAKEYQWGTWEI
jgi:hypothetical protein